MSRNNNHKKVLVTGGMGFIGSEVVNQLVNLGYKPKVVDNLSKDPNTVSLSNNIEFVKGDLSSAKFTQNVFRDVDVCIHLAGLIGGIGYFHKYPADILSVNNKINSNVFEAAVKFKIERIINISSSMVFESSSHFPLTEDMLDVTPPPKSSYGFSKLVGEKYCEAFSKQFGLKYIIIRPFNVYGIKELPGEEIGYSHVIPDLAKKILSGQYPLEILGKGNQSRCFTHVQDVARAIVMALESNSAINNDFNISSTEETRIIDLAKMIWKICKRGEEFKIKNLASFEHDVQRRYADNSKAKKILGWSPKINLDLGLPPVIEWLRNNVRS